MSYNIRTSKSDKETENAWSVRRPATISLIEDIEPDVFGLQEARTDQLEYIAENCPDYDMYGVGRDDGVSKGEHMMVCWNKNTIKMHEGSTFWMSDTPDEPSSGWGTSIKRSTTVTLMEYRRTGQKFFFVNTHLDHVSTESQTKGLALIVERVAEVNPEGYPMVLVGDFNINPDHPSLTELDKIMLSARTYSLYEKDTNYTFNGWKEVPDEPVEIIDYIYYSGFEASLYFKRVTKQYDGIKFISDHYPVVSELVF